MTTLEGLVYESRCLRSWATSINQGERFGNGRLSEP